MKVDISILKSEILSLATEDYFGLYEIIWGLNYVFSNLGEAEKISHAKQAVMLLLQDELIQLYKIETEKKTYVLITSDQVNTVLDQVISWQPGTSYIGFTATPKGERTYFNKNQTI